MRVIKTKLKSCSKCKKNKVIWRTIGKDRYCATCFRSVQKPKPIPNRSSKTKTKDIEYSLIRKAFLIKHTMCEAHLPGCTNFATEVHHKRGRGEYLLDISTWLPVCRTCHVFIENNPKIAKEKNLSEDRLTNI